MNRFFTSSTLKQGPFFACLLLFLAIPTVLVGPVDSTDMQTFLRWGEGLVAAGFDFQLFQTQSAFWHDLTHYKIWIYIVGAAHYGFKGSELIAIIVYSLLSLSLCYTLLNRFMQKTLRLTWGAPGTFLLMLVSWPQVQWLSFGQSGISYLIFVTVSLILAFTVLDRQSRGGAYLLPLAALWIVAYLAFHYRPPGVVMLGFSLAVSFKVLLKPLPTPLQGRLYWGAFALGGLAVLVFASWFFLPDQAPLPIMSDRTYQYLHGLYSRGLVVWDRPETFLAAPTTLWGHLMLQGARMVAMFAFLPENYSLGHKIVNALYFIPLYGLSLYAVYGWVRGQLPTAHGQMMFLIASFFGVLLVFHGVTFIDYDWRYRMPLYPAFHVMAAIALQKLYADFILRRHPAL